MQISTSAGVHLTVRRIERQVLDSFAVQHPVPIPPEKEVTLYGGFKDTVPDEDNPLYRQLCIEYALLFFNDQMSIVLDGVEIQDNYSDFTRYRSLVETGVIRPENKNDFLQFVAMPTEQDAILVINAILYLSTTTERGMAEATRVFNATWSNLPVENIKVAKTPAKFSRYYEDREAARFGGYNWTTFCALPGPEQSAVVAQYRTATRLAYLSEEWAQRKK